MGLLTGPLTGPVKTGQAVVASWVELNEFVGQAVTGQWLVSDCRGSIDG